MSIPAAMRRVLRTSIVILRNEGIPGLRSAIRQRAEVKSQIAAADRADFVTLDGCTFSLIPLGDTPMKLELLRKEYEKFERHAVLQYVRPECPVIELGACIGVVACVTNRMLQGARSHIVVEASPLVIPLMEENRILNHCDFEILNAAIAYDRQTVTFTPLLDFWGNSLRQETGSEPVTVPTITLNEIVSRRNLTSFTLICDIEGHEYELVQREADILKHAEMIILETHARMIGEAKNSELLETLIQIGFEKIDEDATVVVLRRSA
jgi:FkbM family methyltransferase